MDMREAASRDAAELSSIKQSREVYHVINGSLQRRWL